jgi:hypothetical protein
MVKASFENVEKVVKPPQNPVTNKALADGERAPLPSASPSSRPKPRQIASLPSSRTSLRLPSLCSRHSPSRLHPSRITPSAAAAPPLLTCAPPM